ncbi:protein OSCP1 [Polistes fuscatus]|uniref:protein OSCP1 n=1 Tax=Polistes fuscatus TaxID=30207 RepID=UPI001CA80535|nr:protein OSCP1 [Polistes fuscatus]
MSMHATPILYLNMGGEMLYVLQQRLKAQKIDVDKTVQVLNDVTAALLNATVLSSVFKKGPVIAVASLRPTLECAALSSIMKLDNSSMDKLFDLMTMMVKYQLTVVTGPREVILLTLNHIDAMRDMVSNSTGQECVMLIHQMVIDFYSDLTFDEVWRMRYDCLQELEPYRVRVSILLRLGLQNEDTSFNLTSQKYDEKYEENRHILGNQKIKDVDPNKNCGGSFQLFGERETLLGRNIYSSTYGMTEKLKPLQHDSNFLKDCGTKAELEMLATQLGTEETYERPFTLNLFSNEEDTSNNKNKCNIDKNNFEKKEQEVEKTKINEDYKNKLDNVYADFHENELEKTARSMDLLDLLDEIE